MPRWRLPNLAIELIGGPRGETLSTILCLKPGALGLTLGVRRQMALARSASGAAPTRGSLV
jgi:hypothetical protein